MCLNMPLGSSAIPWNPKVLLRVRGIPAHRVKPQRLDSYMGRTGLPSFPMKAPAWPFWKMQAGTRTWHELNSALVTSPHALTQPM